VTANSSSTGQVFVGCSGWSYPSWKPGFYPPKTSAKQFLSYYASQLNSVEVNYTFRQLPRPATLQTWLAAVKAESESTGFRFSFKAPQAITHFKRLQDCHELLASFYASLLTVVDAGCMGLVLFQLPPNFKADRERLALFLDHAAKYQRISFEFRHASWFTQEIFATLRAHNAALCVAASDDLATPDEQTADFSCYRLRESQYTPDQLQQMAADFQQRAAKGDVFAYFKHEDEPLGPLRARAVLSNVELARNRNA
jgi:uncharacterized protein YecE (DUF72 family)